MFWVDEVVQKLKERKLPLEWVDDMKTPSGKVHVGALMGVVIHDLVYRALKNQGVDVTYTYVFENHDPMDDIPSYLPRDKFEKYLGMPLFAIPSPVEGYESFAMYYAQDFKNTFNAIGSNPKILWTKDLYTSGKMNNGIKLVLDNAEEIRKIYKELYKKEIDKDWYPFQVYCQQCEKVSTTEVTYWDGMQVTYRCRMDKVKWTKGCGYEGKTSPFSGKEGIKGKMPWKVEWAVKWQAIGVTIEGAGKDHMSRGGSHDLASLVAKRVLHYEVPYPISYEWILIGGRKMSSSRGVGIAASDMLTILPPELIRFLIVKMDIRKQANFDPAEPETIPKLFDEYQLAALEHKTNPKSDLGRIFELSQISKEIKYPPTLRFQHLTQWVQMPNMEEEIEKEGLTDWVPYARVWIEKYAPDSMKFFIQKEIPESAKKLSKKQKNYLLKVSSQLDKQWETNEFQKELYEWAKESDISSTEAFQAIYLSLIGKDHGPKAAWLIFKHKEFVQKRFSEVSETSLRAERSNLNGIAASSFDKLRTPRNDRFNKPEIFSIEKELKEKFPSISVGVAIIKNVSIKKLDESLEKEKEELLSSLENLTTEQLGQYPEVISYRKLYKEMELDWHSRRPSPEALLRRVALKKGVYTINTCVDAYNLIVMKYKVSVGAFDLDTLDLPTVLRLAKTGEEILLLGDSEPTKYTEKEIAYFDKKGGFNIDFNYRDSQKTAVQLHTKNLYINVDGVYDISPEKVQQVLQETCDIITKYCGGTVELFGIETASE